MHNIYVIVMFNDRDLPFRSACVPIGGNEDVSSLREEISKTLVISVKAKVTNKETIRWFIVTTTCTHIHNIIYNIYVVLLLIVDKAIICRKLLG